MEQAPVQIGQFILGKNLGIGAFGKVRAVVVVAELQSTDEDDMTSSALDACVAFSRS